MHLVLILLILVAALLLFRVLLCLAIFQPRCALFTLMAEDPSRVVAQKGEDLFVFCGGSGSTQKRMLSWNLPFDGHRINLVSNQRLCSSLSFFGLIESHEATLREYVAKHGIKRLHIAGFSLGGCVAAKLAHSLQAQKLTIINGFDDWSSIIDCTGLLAPLCKLCAGAWVTELDTAGYASAFMNGGGRHLRVIYSVGDCLIGPRACPGLLDLATSTLVWTGPHVPTPEQLAVWTPHLI